MDGCPLLTPARDRRGASDGRDLLLWMEVYMKRFRTRALLLFAVAASLAAVTFAFAQGPSQLRARLNGRSKVPAVITSATGDFTARILNDGTIEYELSYSGLEGTA